MVRRQGRKVTRTVGNLEAAREIEAKLKVDIAKEAILRASKAIGHKDYLGILTFDSQPRWALPLTQLPDEAAIEGAIAAFSASVFGCSRNCSQFSRSIPALNVAVGTLSK